VLPSILVGRSPRRTLVRAAAIVAVSAAIFGWVLLPVRAQGISMAMAMAAKAAVPGQGLDVRFVDVEVDVAPGGADAVARMTATVAERGVAADRGIDARELEMAWRKMDGDWLIARVTGIETLQRPR
jgi:hypothetical protein